MVSDNSMPALLRDLFEAVVAVARLSSSRLLTAWISVPIGTCVILLACWGIDALIGMSSVSFPASVACMIILFFALVGCQTTLGDRKTRGIVRVVDIPTGFALRYINIFFTPSFVLLPLSPPIGGIEVAKIIALCLIGYVVMVASTAYLTRGLLLIFGSSKRAMTERAEELPPSPRADEAQIPLTEYPDTERSKQISEASIPPSGASSISGMPPLVSAVPLAPPPRAQDPDAVRGTGGPPISQIIAADSLTAPPIRQDSAPLTRPQRWATWINVHLDTLTYTIFLLTIGMPVYYAIGYAMPLHVCINILAYFAAVALPAKWKRFLHPVLVSSLLTVLVIWLFAATVRTGILTELQAYKTGRTYLQLWGGDGIEKDEIGQGGTQRPGAGDVFASCLDVSIVSLALPMFRYRHELVRHFWQSMIPALFLSITSLLAYPPLAAAMGIAPSRALSFVSRSLTLALAIPATTNLDGDTSLVAVLCIVSGILGVLIGPWLLKMLRIPEDDYLTRGVTLGGNSSAIATALLLVTDPRAAALSSVELSLFGIFMVALTSVPPVAQFVGKLAGM